ncbi:hypothetical protein MMC29_006945 [Sticta canariensis]|nr:hypothetical protein [Sticta canariensis]
MGSSANSRLRLFILPKNASPNARFCTLAHPRTSQPSRYYFCSQKGPYELTRVAAPKVACQSWLLGPEETDGISVSDVVEKKGMFANNPEHVSGEAGQRNGDSEVISNGYVVKDPELFVATPIDPLFFILPAFLTKSSSNKPSALRRVFQSLDDLLESLLDNSKHVEQTICHDEFRQSIEARTMVVCDMVSAGNETMYRLNLDKLLQELLFKAKKAVALSLPASMEDRFIRKALEVPATALKHEESSISEQSKASQEEEKVSDSRILDAMGSQSIVETSCLILSAKTEIKNPDVEPPEEKDENIPYLLRLRTALSYMTQSYLPSFLAISLNTKLCSVSSPIDFAGLDQYLANISTLRAEALASRSMFDFSRKRSLQEDDEVAGPRVNKKRKKDEDEKRRKAGESRAKKIDISGMKKISEFFGKGAVKKTN